MSVDNLFFFAQAVFFSTNDLLSPQVGFLIEGFARHGLVVMP